MLKKAISLLLIISLFVTCTMGANAKTSCLPGDVNLDNEVDSNDALLILQNSVGLLSLDGVALVNARVSSKSGDPDSSDALMVLQYSVGLIEYFPAECEDVTYEAWDDQTERNYYYSLQNFSYDALLPANFVLVDNLQDCPDRAINKLGLDETFFEQNSLLMFEDYMSTSSYYLRITDIYTVGNTLYVSMTRAKHFFQNCDISGRIYCVKINQKLNDIQSIKYNLNTITLPKI